MIHTQAYKKLQEHFTQSHKTTLLDMFNTDNTRVNKFNLSLDGLYFDFSKNNITEETLSLLIQLAHESGLTEKISAMFNGDKINNTENRAVLHTALRSPNKQVILDGVNVCTEIQLVLNKMKLFSEKLHTGQHKGYTGKPITDIINIGIGGSDLGPVLVTQALKPYRKNNLNVHFISSIDGYQLLDTLSNLNPATTLFIVASKTFTTQETITNALTTRKWFLDKVKDTRYIKQHFVAVSTNTRAVTEFGIDPENMFEFWDFVGGRYSLWSAIGLSIILYIGFDNFNKLLAGAHSVDEHFRETKDLHKNIPVILGLLSVWYANFYNYATQIISPYNTRLTRFPAYVQQLAMESNGKSVNKNGELLSYKTCPVIWGDSGINGQHAYYQLLHQGTSIYPMDIIYALSDEFSIKEHNDILVANAIAQAEAFMRGKSYETAKQELLKTGVEPHQATEIAKHKVFTGNRPTNTITLNEISPYSLGMLIAIYEHKTFTEGVIWQINSFDQMGVELGKQLAKTIYNDISSKKISAHDNSTTQLINNYTRID